MKKRGIAFNPHIIFFFISLTLVTVWFRGGSTLGGGEVGVPFYNLNRMLEMSQMAWSDRGLGMSTGFSVGGAPYYKFFSILQELSIPGFLLQAGFFLICLFTTLSSAYVLVKEVLPKISRSACLLSALFYLVNPFSLVNIWNRFLPNQIMFYSFLPLGMWLYIRGLKTGRYSYAVLNMSLSAIFSVAFIGPSQTIIFWGLMFFLTTYYYFVIDAKKTKFIYFIANLVLWLTFNLFWISQQLYFRFSQSFNVISSTFFTSVGNIETFNSLSRELGKLSNLFLLQHGSFFKESTNFPQGWPLLYNYPLSIALQWVLAISVLFIAVRNIKDVWIKCFFMIFILGIFVSKGNSAPLGEIIDVLFKKITLFEFFRNPFEKAGILLSLGLTPLVGLAINEWNTNVKKWACLLPWLYICVFLGFPFWSGLVFTSGYHPANNSSIGYQVIPPNYYALAEKYLSAQPGLFRFITFPLGGEGIFNTWSKGYVGVEQSGVLFSAPSLSYNTTIPFYSQIATSLEELFVNYPDFYRIAGMLNVKYLLFRPDFDYMLSGMRDPDTIDELLVNRASDPLTKLRLVNEIPPLKIYEFSEESTLPRIYAAHRNIRSDGLGSLEDALLVEAEPRDVISNTNSPYLAASTFVDISHTQALFYLGSRFPEYADEYYIFPYVSTPPGSFRYQQIRLKEQLQLLVKFSPVDKTLFQILLLGKRLKETKLALDLGNEKIARQTLESYIRDLPNIMSQIKHMTGFKQPSERTWREQEMFTTFSSHLFVLNEFEKSSLNQDGFVTDTISKFRKQTTDARILPRYDPIVVPKLPLSERVVYQWVTNIEGDYEILIPGSGLFPDEFLFPSRMLIQIDDQIKEITPKKTKAHQLSLGTQKLSTGLHELQIVPPPTNNLLGRNTNLELLSTDMQVQHKLPIPKFDPYSQYNISFDYKTIFGSGLDFSIYSNLDQLNSKTHLPNYYFTKALYNDNYWYDVKNFSTVFNPSPSSDRAEIIFTASVWNNCLDSYSNLPTKCLDELIRKKFDRPTKIEVKNITVSPRIPRRVILISHHDGSIQNGATPEIVYSRSQLTDYKIHISNAKSPFLLVFSELYHPGWKVTLDGEVLGEDRHIMVNGYANSWWIEKTGDFDLSINYKPQEILDKGYLISAISISVALLVLLVGKPMKKI